MKSEHDKIKDKEELRFEGLMRLVEGIILNVLDQCLISGKWENRDISLEALNKKRRILRGMLKWFRDPKWDIWLNIYCKWNGYNKRHIKKNFEKIRKKSVTYVNKRIKVKKGTVDN